MRKITDLEAKNLKMPGKWLYETIGKRGEGELVLRGGDPVKAYYRYTYEGSRVRLPLGSFSDKQTLQNARDKAQDYSRLRREHPDLKAHLHLEELRNTRKQKEETLQQQAEARKGTLGDLLNDYADNLVAQGKRSATEVRRFFQKDIRDVHPQLIEIRACDIGPSDIREILQAVWDRGAAVQYNRGRAYLHSAFMYALSAEHDVARKSDKVYGLVTNPVAALPRHGEVENAGERALNDKELEIFYNGIEQADNVGILVATFMRFCVAVGGQRPDQILHAQWTDYDMEHRTLRIVDRKGRSGSRVHLVPLTDRALDLLERVRPFTGGHDWPFSYTGKAPLTLPTLNNAINRFLAGENAKVEGKPILHFTARDLRRTVKQFMLRHGIRPDLADVLQNHAQGGLVGRHYANDPTVTLPAKWQAINAFESALADVLNGVHKNKVVPIKPTINERVTV